MTQAKALENGNMTTDKTSEARRLTECPGRIDASLARSGSRRPATRRHGLISVGERRDCIKSEDIVDA